MHTQCTLYNLTMTVNMKRYWVSWCTVNNTEYKVSLYIVQGLLHCAATL